MKKLFILALLLQTNVLFAQKKPASFYVETKDSLPFLEYGLGTDRLGGAKMTFLDSNIVLKIIDSFGTKYKVQLSQSQTAWIEKELVKPVAYKPLLQSLSGSWTVSGDSLYDYVAIQVPERVPYNSWMEVNPAKIVVDIYGITSNTNWITQLQSAEEIKNVSYQQVEDGVMRVFIELKHQQNWGYHIFYDSLQRLSIRVNRQPKKLRLRDLRIAVDAGHGGSNIGTRGIRTGILEKDYTLLFAKELEKQLKAHQVKVIMTREKDTSLSMYERINFLQKEQPQLLISIHFNSSSNRSIEGVSTYYRYLGFRPLSTAILKSMLTLGLNDFGNIGSFNFALSGPTEFPNCLVEVAFLSNPGDEKKVRSEDFRKEVAQKIISGIEAFLDNL